MHQSFAPKLSLDYMSPPAPVDPGYGKFDPTKYFENYRNEFISRIYIPNNERSRSENMYTPCSGNLPNRYLHLPESQATMIDQGRHNEVDNFYIASQLHRDQYRNDTRSVHSLDYFKLSEYQYQCPIDPTTQYLKCPKYYLKYRQPVVLPLTLERDLPMTLLPDRALTGVYNKSSDVVYKR